MLENDSHSDPATLAERSLWAPRSIAVIGASETHGSFGERVMRYLRRLEYEGRVYPVNPSYAAISGHACFPSVSDLPGIVDAAIIGLSQPKTIEQFAALAEKGCRLAIVMGAGYGEAGEEGLHFERRLVAEAARHGIRVLGPNTTGAVNVVGRVALGASSLMGHPDLRSGPAAVIGQSGSLVAGVGDQLLTAGIGLTYAFGIGNAVDVSAAELLSMLAGDADTTIILAMMEGVGDPEAFASATREVHRAGKRLIVVKSGRSEAGSRIAANHSGAMVGSWEAFRSLVESNGGLVARDVDAAIDIARLVAAGFTPGSARRLHAVTMSGALSGLFADEAAQAGLPLREPEPGGPLERVMTELGYSAPLNPVDYGQVPRGEGARDALNLLWSAVLADPDTTSLLVVASTTHHLDYMAELLERLSHETTPIVCYAPPGRLIDGFVDAVTAAGLPVFRDMARAVEAIEAIRTWPAPLPAEASRLECSFPANSVETLREMKRRLTEANAAAYLAEFGLHFPRGVLLSSAENLAAADVSLPAVLKVSSSSVIHKAAAGLVFLPLHDRDALAGAFEECREKAEEIGCWEDEVFVQELVDIRSGVEMICATRDDPEAGLVLVLGLGGSFAEVFRAVTVSVLPETPAQCREILGRNELIARIDAALGGIGLVERLVTPVMALADAARFARAEISDLEVNPLVVYRDKREAVALDAVATLREIPVPSTGKGKAEYAHSSAGHF